MDVSDTVLLTGATGFVGTHLEPVLTARGYSVRCGTRDVRRKARGRPDARWVELDVHRGETLGPAFEGVRAAIYLVHEMGGGPGYEEREKNAARVFAEEAARAGVERIVYLGGVAPRGRASRHLRSRLLTGETLRAGAVPVFELRAAMIIGHGSVSWHIVRDLAARLPAMLLPKWLATRSQPIAVDDVVHAISGALALPIDAAGVYDVPGPEVLTAKEILLRVARLRGTRPFTISVPVLSPHLSSYWLKFVTGADYHVARELIEGLSSDLVVEGRGLWTRLPPHDLVPFDEAARRALVEDEERLQRGRWFEQLIARLSRRAAPTRQSA
jgi:uncharacterized protein YbjT (DUF2867 family)